MFTAKADKAYIVADASGENEDIDGLIVEMSAADYAAMFESDLSGATQACLYYSSDEAARVAIANLPEGYMGLLSTSNIYVQNSGDIFTTNVLWYVALIQREDLSGGLCCVSDAGHSEQGFQPFAVYPDGAHLPARSGVVTSRFSHCDDHPR